MSNIVVTIPSVQQVLVWKDNIQHVVMYNLNRTYVEVSGDVCAKDVGEYSINIKLKFPESSTWTDGTTDDITLTWKIIPLTVPIPSQSNELYYISPKLRNGTYDYAAATQRPTWINYNVKALSIIGGTLQAIDVGVHKVIVALKSKNYIWEDKTTEPKEISWTIKNIPLSAKPSFSGSIFHYTGLVQGPEIIDYDSDCMVMEGDPREIDVGDYHISIKPNNNYTWSDGTTTPVEFDWSILAVTLEKPYIDDKDKVYNEEDQFIYDNLNPIFNGTKATNGIEYK